MSQWIEVATIYEIPENAVLSVEVEGLELAIFRIDGAFYAIEDLCTHADAALSDGFIEGSVVYCPLHGAKFDVKTGRALCPPAYEPVRVFPLRLQDERIEVEIE